MMTTAKEPTMTFFVTAFLVAGAFGIAGTATATPASPWLARVGVRTRKS
jgi:hypothetical protein